MNKKLSLICFLLLLLALIVLASCKHSHEFEINSDALDFIPDESGHWLECSCGEKLFQEHNFSIVNECEEKCEICEFTNETHTFPSSYQYDEKSTCFETGKKYRYCSKCGKKDEGEIPFSRHNFIYSFDQNNHWKKCDDCGLEKEEEPHQFIMGKCSSCNYELKQGSVELDYKIDSIDKSCCVRGIKSETITEIIIPSYHQQFIVKEIDDNTFKNCRQLISIDIPGTVKSLDKNAFSNCPNLRKITLPLHLLSSIPMEQIEEVVIISGSKIDASFFSNCSNLKKITLPSTIVEVEDNTFSNCKNITDANIPADVLRFIPLDNLEHLVINSGETLTDSISSNTKLQSLVVLEGLKFINSSFTFCTKLNYISLPSSIEEIKNDCFKNSNIKKASIPATVIASIPKGTLEEVNIVSGPKVEKNAFANCKRLATITISDSVQVIEEGAFENCPNIKKASIPATVIASIPKDNLEEVNIVSGPKVEKNAFANCKRLATITISDSVQVIEEGAFENCPNIKKASIPTTAIASIPKDNLEEVNIISGKEIEKNAFANCKNLITITISDSIEAIGSDAFLNCPNLEFNEYSGGLYLGSKKNEFVWLIKFQDANETIELHENTKFIYSPIKIDSSKSKKITIFKEFKFLSPILDTEKIDIYYEGNVEDLCKLRFKNSGLNPMSYAEHFYIRNAYNDWVEITELKIPNSITELGTHQFYGYKTLKSITIPTTILSIGNNAFEDCKSLENVYYEGTIENWCNITFSNAYSNPMSFAKHFFLLEYGEWKEVTSLKLPSTLTTINDYQFYGFNNITSVTMPDSITSIGESAFENCSGLTEIELSNSIMRLGTRVFYNCDLERNYNKYDNAYYLGSKDNKYLILMKAVNNQINSCYVHSDTKFIYNDAFKDCYNLVNITIEKEVIEIKENAFLRCYRLVEIYNLSKIKLTVGSSQNGDVSRYARVIHTSTKDKSNLYSFQGFIFLLLDMEYYLIDCKQNLKSTVLPELVYGKEYTISSSAFYNSVIEEVVIPEGTKGIEKESFNLCQNLKIIYYQGSKEKWLNITNNSLDQLNNIKVYFYLKEKPDISGNYWHYENDRPIPWYDDYFDKN